MIIWILCSYITKRYAIWQSANKRNSNANIYIFRSSFNNTIKIIIIKSIEPWFNGWQFAWVQSKWKSVHYLAWMQANRVQTFGQNSDFLLIDFAIFKREGINIKAALKNSVSSRCECECSSFPTDICTTECLYI